MQVCRPQREISTNMHNCIAATVVTLLLIIEQSCGRLCSSQTVTDFPTQVGTQVLVGDLQLLIPAWRINDDGYIFRWQAIVQGSVSSSAIEFQIFRPNPTMSGVYDLVYGNMYNRYQEQIGNRVNINVNVINTPPDIPINPGDIIGIRLRNNIPGADSNFGLQYSTPSTGAGVDVYYWQGMGSQACSLSLSSAGVLREITPLVSWTFCDLAYLPYISQSVRNDFATHKSANPLICSLTSDTSLQTPSTSDPVTSDIPTTPSPSSVTPLLSTNQSPSSSNSLFTTLKAVSSTNMVVPYSSISSSTPVVTVNPRVSKESYAIPLAVGVTISMLLLTAVACAVIILVIIRQFTRKKGTAVVEAIEPVQYDQLSSVRNVTHTTVLPPNDSTDYDVIQVGAVAVKSNIAYETQIATNHDFSSANDEATIQHMDTPNDQSLPLPFLRSDNSTVSSAVGSNKQFQMSGNVAYDHGQDINMKCNVAYNS